MTLTVFVIHLPISKQGFDAELNSHLNILDEAEIQRYWRFKNEHARATFLQTRVMLKTSLAKKLGCAAREITFNYNEYGKPSLLSALSNRWHLSVSHSNQNIVIALAEENIGIDVEDVDRCKKLIPQTRDFLNQHAQVMVEQCPSEQESAECFTEYWCCLESYVKLRGSAIWQEKERVQPEQIPSPEKELTRFQFEDTYFHSLYAQADARIVLACHSANIELEFNTWPAY